VADEDIPLEAPVPIGTMTTDDDEIPLLVVLTGATDETPVPIGAVGPAETVPVLVPLS
jgi:hypothetical protein